MTTYLGHPCLITAQLVGRYRGKKGAKVDKYGANLAAAVLPGQGHSVLHNQLQTLLQAIMKPEGILPDKEAAKFLLGKVGEPHITLYVNHVTRQNNGNRRDHHAIVPDLHAMNFPVGKQSINDSDSSREAEVIVEIKTFTTCKSRYAHNNTKKCACGQKSKDDS